MPDDYALPAWKARICRLAGWLFALAAGLMFLVPIIGLSITGHPLNDLHCNIAEGCEVVNNGAGALDDDVRQELASTPGATERYARHIARPAIWIPLATVSGVPLAALLFGVAMALRTFGLSRVSGHKAKPELGGALRWLRLSAIAAVLGAIWTPLDGLLTSVLLLPGTPFGRGFMIEVDGGPFALHLMLALTTVIVVWALEAGHQAQRDLAEIV